MNCTVFTLILVMISLFAGPTYAQSGKVVSVHAQKNLAFVMYSSSEAEPLKLGSPIAIKTKKGQILKGTLIHKGKWFDKIMAKIQLPK